MNKSGHEADLYTDIAIVGGGLMGAALALLLVQTLPNRRVLLLEQHPLSLSDLADTPNPSWLDARTTALAPTSAYVLRRLNVWAGLGSNITPIQRVQVSDRGHLGWVRLDTDNNDGEPLGYIVENRALNRALLEALRTCDRLDIQAPAQVEWVKPKAEGVHLRFNNQDCWADLVIIADGADSPLRAQLGIQTSDKDYQQSAVIANVRHSEAHQETAFERFTADGPVAFLPLGGVGGKTSAVVWTWPAAEAESALIMSDAEFLTKLQTVFGHRLGALEQVSARQRYPLRLKIAQEQVRTGIVLMGNAAHFLHPVAGQGYNLALRDGLRLAEVLSTAKSNERLGRLALLQQYEQAQIEDQRNTIRLSDGFNEIFRAKGLTWAAARNLGMIGVEWSSVVRQLFIRQLSGRGTPRANPWAASATHALLGFRSK